MTVPHVHDVARLVEQLDLEAGAVPPLVNQAPCLARYATVTRYPQVTAPVTADDHSRAIAIAEAVVAWAAAEIGTGAGRGR